MLSCFFRLEFRYTRYGKRGSSSTGLVPATECFDDLTDPLGRRINFCRFSVTDRCNLRSIHLHALRESFPVIPRGHPELRRSAPYCLTGCSSGDREDPDHRWESLVGKGVVGFF